MTTFQASITTTSNRASSRAALATAAGIRGWWSKNCSVATEVGGDVEMTFEKGDRTVEMKFRIDALDEHRVGWTCMENGNPVWPGTTLEWTLQPAGEGTKITFTHAGFEDANHPAYALTVGAQGWGHFLASLQAYLDTGVGQPG